MATFNFKTLAAAVALGTVLWNPTASAGTFKIDLNAILAVPGATLPAGITDGVTRDLNEIQFNIQPAANVVTAVFSDPIGAFNAATTFTFTDVGSFIGTALLPPGGLGADNENYSNSWQIEGSFSLTGTGFIAGVDGSGNPILSFEFNPGGSIEMFYRDNDDLIQVLDGFGTRGEGLVAVDPGSFVSAQPSGAGFTFSGTTSDLLDGFFLLPGGTPFGDLSLALVDGNLDQVSSTIIDDFTLAIRSRTDGSATIETVPEPGTLALMGLGLMGLARRSRKQAAR